MEYYLDLNSFDFSISNTPKSINLIDVIEMKDDCCDRNEQHQIFLPQTAVI